MVSTSHTTDADTVVVPIVCAVVNVVAITYSASEYDIGRCCRMANKHVEISIVAPREVIQIAGSSNVTSGEIVCHRLARPCVYPAGTTVEVADPSYMVIYTPDVTG